MTLKTCLILGSKCVRAGPLINKHATILVDQLCSKLGLSWCTTSFFKTQTFCCVLLVGPKSENEHHYLFIYLFGRKVRRGREGRVKVAQEDLQRFYSASK